MEDQKYKFDSLIVTQNMMRYAAQSCVRTMEILEQKHGEEFGAWLVPYYALAAIALEGFAKLTLVRQETTNKKSISQIEEHLITFGHDLDKIFSQKGVGLGFLSKAQISDVKRVNDKELFISRYEFLMEQGESIKVYDLESLRYGLMSTRANAGVVAYQSAQLLKLCQNVQVVALGI